MGWRSWTSAKAVAVLAAIALAVGIGSTTAIYTVVNAVMLKPLPYQHGERFADGTLACAAGCGLAGAATGSACAAKEDRASISKTH